MAGAGSSGAAPARGLVVVTGARGFLGAAVLAAFVAEGRRCEGWVRSGPLDTGVPLRVVGDLAEATESTLRDALAGVTAIVHLAGRAHVTTTTRNGDAFERDNVTATGRLARAARDAGVARFVHVSSVKVNGESTARGRPFRTGDPPRPGDAYAESKWRAEQALHEALDGSATKATVLRIPMTYGPGARANFAALVAAVRAGWPLPIGSVANRRHLLSVDNLVGALGALLEVRTPVVGTYFIADADPVSTRVLVTAIGRALGRPPRLVRVPIVLLRAAGALTGRTATVDRLTGSLEVDTRPFETATGWRPAPFALDARAVSSVADESTPGRSA